MVLIFKMDLVWWIDIFIRYVLPVLALIILILGVILIVDVVSGGKYAKRKKNL